MRINVARVTLAGMAALAIVIPSAAASASTTAKPPRQTTCFRGEYAFNAARPGASCFLGGLFIRTDLGGGHYDFIWGMARYEHGGLEHVVIRDDYTVPVNEMEVVLVGYVQDGPRHFWPFRDPFRDRELCHFHWYGIHHPPLCPPVVNILHAGGRHDELHPPCIQDLSTTPIGTGALYTSRCSPEGQGAKDKRYTQMVWMPGHRIDGVRKTNADRHGFICLSASLDPVNDAYVIWVPENEKLANLGVQYWYEIAHLHS